MHLNQKLKGHITQYTVAAFNAITEITPLTQHLKSTHI